MGSHYVTELGSHYVNGYKRETQHVECCTAHVAGLCDTSKLLFCLSLHPYPPSLPPHPSPTPSTPPPSLLILRAPVQCGSVLRLQHVQTRKFLHSHRFKSPLSGTSACPLYMKTSFQVLSLLTNSLLWVCVTFLLCAPETEKSFNAFDRNKKRTVH